MSRHKLGMNAAPLAILLLLAGACASRPVHGVAPRLDFQLPRPASAETDRALRLPCGPARKDAAERGDVVYLHDGVERPATHRGRPAMARHPGVAGEVTLEFVIDTAGAVERGTIRATSAAPEPIVATAVEAVLQSQFVPALAGGRAVRQCVEQSYAFNYFP